MPRPRKSAPQAPASEPNKAAIDACRRALAEAGIDRAQVYVTNAVKHFKHELRGKRRLHKKPSDMEIEASARARRGVMSLHAG